jgi:ribosome-binding protein aMBF1 (putative translation factor)
MTLKKDYFPLKCSEAIENIGILVKNSRKNKNIRQLDLAESIGVSVSTIKKLEKGDAKIEIGLVLKAMWFLGIDNIFDSISYQQEVDKTRVRHKKTKPQDF